MRYMSVYANMCVMKHSELRQKIAVTLYIAYSIIGFIVFVATGNHDDNGRSLSALGTHDTDVPRNMQFAAYLSLHGAITAWMYYQMFDHKMLKYTLCILIMAFEYATASISVRENVSAHDAVATVSFALIVIGNIAVVIQQYKERETTLWCIILAFTIIAVGFLIAFAAANVYWTEYVGIALLSLIPIAFYWVKADGAAGTSSSTTDQYNVVAWYLLMAGIIAGIGAGVYEVVHIYKRHDDQQAFMNKYNDTTLHCGRQNWGSPLALALFKVFAMCYIVITYLQHKDKWMPLFAACCMFVLWTFGTGAALYYDHQPMGTVLGVALGAICGCAALVWGVFFGLYSNSNNNTGRSSDKEAVVPNTYNPMLIAPRMLL